jgi:hypothetical protein
MPGQKFGVWDLAIRYSSWPLENRFGSAKFGSTYPWRMPEAIFSSAISNRIVIDCAMALQLGRFEKAIPLDTDYWGETLPRLVGMVVCR